MTAMNDNPDPAEEMRNARVLHGFVVYGVFALAVLAGVSVWIGAHKMLQAGEQKAPVSSVEAAGKRKPLPDYMLEKVGPDELEDLKP
ncbi:MAG: hypothetical protein KDI13_03775 [Alphaproteobacteria bacterium]|nr:hypothetical protein [Alphaproteobacteria bacterium]